MFNIKQKIAHELLTFHSLENKTKRFLISAIGYTVADILLFTFGYALIFQRTGSVTAAAVFNLAFYLTLLIGFYINGKLLSGFPAKPLFILGGLLQGSVITSMFFLPPSEFWQIGIFGLIYGLPLGIYWGNRNRLYLYFTNNNNRHYFEGLRRLIGDPLTAISPLVAGWFIVFYTHSVIDANKLPAYQLVGVFGLALLAFSMIGLIKIPFPRFTVTTLKVPRLTKHWQIFRWFVIISSFQFALVLALPEVLTLKYLGNEGILGTLKMLFVIFSALIVYILGRRTQAKSRLSILKLSAWPLIIAAGLVLIKTSPITITIYLLTMAISDSIFWFVYFPIMSRAIEKETENNKQVEYAYILDHEIWINIGRIVATLGYFFLVYALGDEQGMMLAIFIGGIMQIIGFLVAKKMLILAA